MLESLVVTLAIYRRAFTRGAVLAVKNWPVLLSVFAYLVIIGAGLQVAGVLGIAGGFLSSLVSSACIASFLYLVEMMVRTNKVTWEDFTHSFGVYLWDVVGVNFALWLLSFVSRALSEQVPQAPALILVVLVVLFNAVPELIYLGHHSLMDLLSSSYRFVANNWIEWFPPNVLLLLGAALIVWMPVRSGPVGWILQVALLALFGYFAMVVRGFLFIELDGSTRRARIFRHKMGR